MSTQDMSRRKFMGLAGAATVAAMGVGMVACSPSSASGDEEPAADGEAAPAAGIDKEIIVTSFGTTFDNSRNITIGAIESLIRESYPDWKVQRAFTAQDIIDKLAAGKGIDENGEEDGWPVTIMNFEEALQDAADNGVKTVVVLPTHLTAGGEYGDVKNALGEAAANFETTAIAPCLLNEDADYVTVINAIYDHTKQYQDGETAFVFMGHGNEAMGAPSDAYYDQVQATVDSMEADNPDMKNIFICTVEGSVQKEQALELMKEEGTDYKRVLLEDFMVVCGDHANNDMAGDDEDSAKSFFEGEGYEVIAILDGLGQLYPVQKLYRDHLQATLDENGLA